MTVSGIEGVLKFRGDIIKHAYRVTLAERKPDSLYTMTAVNAKEYLAQINVSKMSLQTGGSNLYMAMIRR